MNYHAITYPDQNNGSGLRVVLWLSGCSHKCRGCQNPQTWDANSGIPFDESAKEELFRELDKDYISGLTLTGGDPLFSGNLDGVSKLVASVNARYNVSQNLNEFRLSIPNKTIWLYTGYVFEDIIKDTAKNKNKENLIRFLIINGIDVLVDGKYINSQRDITLAYRGSSNQRLIDVQQSLQKGEVVLW